MRRVLLALSRFGSRIGKLTVRLAERANPLGGVDRHCAMRAWLQTSVEVQAEAIGEGFEEAAARAAAQLTQRVRSALDSGTSDGGGGPVEVRSVSALRAVRRRPRGG
jgi:hypothetical protein